MARQSLKKSPCRPRDAYPAHVSALPVGAANAGPGVRLGRIIFADVFWRFLGAWQFGLFTPLVERSVAALRAYENATIDADIIFYGALGVNKCTTPVHLFDEKERRRMWLELYEQVLAEVSEDRPSVFDAELTDAEVRAMASVFRARGSGLVKRWVKMQGLLLSAIKYVHRRTISRVPSV